MNRHPSPKHCLLLVAVAISLLGVACDRVEESRVPETKDAATTEKAAIDTEVTEPLAGSPGHDVAVASGGNAQPAPNAEPDAQAEAERTAEPVSNAEPAQSGLPDQLVERWKVEFKQAGSDEETAFEASPAVFEQTVILADVYGTVFAIDRDTGSEIWQRNFDTGFLATPAIKDGALVIGDIEGNLYCIDVVTGKEKWQATTNGEINGTAAFHQENVIVTSQDGQLHCYKMADGEHVWSYQTNDQIRCSPTIAGDITFLGGCDAQLHVVNLLTGEPENQPLPLNGPTGSTPAVSGTTVVVPIMDGTIHAFDWKENKSLWTYEDPDRPQEYRNSPAIGGGLVILSSQFKQVDALSVKTGERVAQYKLRKRADATPVISGDDVWIAASDGRLIRLALETLEPKEWSFETRGAFYAGPTIDGNQLFIADDKGVARCFEGEN